MNSPNPAHEDAPVPALPARAADTTPDQPWPLHHLSLNVENYIHKMPSVWAEGQLVELKRRTRSRLAYMTIRDVDVDCSFTVPITDAYLDTLEFPLQEGARIVFHAQPRFWRSRGSLVLMADEIKPVGLGQLLAQLEKLKQQLAAEGLFNRDRKKPLPFLPRKIGLICGRSSAAEKDVKENAMRRWPGVTFVTREVAVQGPSSAAQVTAALQELDALPEVDVIIITRGGGSLEDLLPFSDETLVRAAAAAQTPVVSAIGHEQDVPLLDFVADFRASTPTDAAKNVVPDYQAEKQLLFEAKARMNTALGAALRDERDRLQQILSRPVMANPVAMLDEPRRQIKEQLLLSRSRLTLLLQQEKHVVQSALGQIRALSPLNVMQRGYSLLQTSDGELLQSITQVKHPQTLTVRVHDGNFQVETTGETSAIKGE